MIAVVILALALVGLIVGVIDVFRTNGQSLPGWGLIAVSAAVLLWRISAGV